jgi:hypothetical protein
VRCRAQDPAGHRAVVGDQDAAGDRGAVTAELALALPAVVLVLAAVLVTVAAGAAQLRCADGARAGARVAALGESDARVAAVARHLAGPGADVRVVRDDPWVEVVVAAELPGGWFTGGAVGLAARATAWAEP